MKTAKIISGLGAVIMGVTIIYALVAGDFNAEGSLLLSMPWGIVSLVDLFTGFTLFAMWIIYREASILRSVIWIILLFTLGFFTGALYTFIALQGSGGDWHKFWMGNRVWPTDQ
jgi:hypothetical protein